MNRHQQQKWAEQDQPAAQTAAPPPPAPPAPVAAAAPAAPAGDRVEQLTQLADLHDRGVLTDVEFAAEKAKILAS